MLYREMLRRDADALLLETRDCAQREREIAAQLLVRLAAVEDRRLYAPPGYSSMWDYCVRELGLSEDAAARRLWAARKAREYPALFDALADGRIQLTAIHVLATQLRTDNANELISAAAGRSKSELQDWLSRRFPKPAVATEILMTRLGSARPLDAGSASDLGSLVGGGTGDDDLDFGAVRGADVSHAPTPLAALPIEKPSFTSFGPQHALARVPVLSNASNPTSSQVPLRVS